MLWHPISGGGAYTVSQDVFVALVAAVVVVVVEVEVVVVVVVVVLVVVVEVVEVDAMSPWWRAPLWLQGQCVVLSLWGPPVRDLNRGGALKG